MTSCAFVKKDGLDVCVLSHPSGATAEVYIYAAHLTSWCTADGGEQLFVSTTAEYGGGKAIRGGVPVCWPQFADRGLYKKHGFCRNSDKWTVLRTSTEPFPCVVLELKDDEQTRAAFPFGGWTLTYAVTLDSPTSITTSMSVLNQGEQPLEFTMALHTYFRCASASSVLVKGLQGLTFEDSTKGGERAVQEEDGLPISGEVDRVYIDAPSKTWIIEGERAVQVLKMGLPDAVVWNIGPARAAELKDLDDWTKYVCVEAAAINKPIKVAAGQSWSAGQTFTQMASSDVPSS
mmetsp:Transcript_382/g.693  ORF Transcript_382/g.693 Transcript_382/m.693 type:complete len:290 (-) Transcript_382:349-1218(-)|eukprot:CAMPEP_0119317820 /NCGR_PEP_ID=MMETSP1333-20130426/44462_1 /TAXON_ID=418940 /ORGANISM="Scyphosphaera apsteinii, Strain RCC1455" /LENGTH=289 /DNA_ID=CAMNT_0007323875 /DNA_START=24 /DNA_END=893 /DNA_ORIENTATION=+